MRRPLRRHTNACSQTATRTAESSEPPVSRVGTGIQVRRPAPRLNRGSRDARIFLLRGRSPARKGAAFSHLWGERRGSRNAAHSQAEARAKGSEMIRQAFERMGGGRPRSGWSCLGWGCRGCPADDRADQRRRDVRRRVLDGRVRSKGHRDPPGARHIPDLSGEGTGVAQVNNISIGGTATAGDRSFRFRDVGADVVPDQAGRNAGSLDQRSGAVSDLQRCCSRSTPELRRARFRSHATAARNSSPRRAKR